MIGCLSKPVKKCPFIVRNLSLSLIQPINSLAPLLTLEPVPVSVKSLFIRGGKHSFGGVYSYDAVSKQLMKI